MEGSGCGGTAGVRELGVKVVYVRDSGCVGGR